MLVADIQPVQITSRFRLPFFPMRPRTGLALSKLEELDGLDPDYHWSLKVNGDRALVGIVNRRAYVANRHGSWFKFGVANIDTFATKLKGAWLLDGEVFQKKFFPFEVVDSPNGTLTNSCPTVRAAAARDLCRFLRVPWLYGSKETLTQEAANCMLELRSSPYEGVVGKLLGSRYVPLGSNAKDSTSWVKRKWVK